MSGGVVMTSDELDQATSERIELLKLLCHQTRSVCSFPLLSQASIQYERIGENRKNAPVRHRSRSIDPVLVQYRPGKSISNEDSPCAMFIFNTGDYPLQRTYPLEIFGILTPTYLYNWTEYQPSCQAVDRIRCSLQPHEGVLIFLSQKPFAKRPDRLP
jgi:hypothetical protein